MKKLPCSALLTVCVVLGLLAACQKREEPAATNGATAATPAADTSSGETPESTPASQSYPGDQEFVTAVGQAGMTEILTGKEADAKSSNAAVQEFAAIMVTQHSELGEQLQQIATSNGFTFPPVGDLGPNQQVVDQLAPLSGSQFDQQYIKDMGQGHKAAVALFQAAAQSAQNPALKEWAAKTLGIIEHHLEMAEAVQAELQ